MRHISDDALKRLRNGTRVPDLTGTRYRLLEEVARGGMGVVYAVKDENLHRRVALKVLEMPGGESELASRLMREARVLASLEHPGIVPVHDVGTLADGRVFYTMKLVEGHGLDKHLESIPSVPDRLRVFLRICDAVAFAHARGVLHRDLKPENVMVGSFGEVLVMDWGLAKLLGDFATVDDQEMTIAEPISSVGNMLATAGTGQGSVLGTPGYMSPEQAGGNVELLDPRTDIFSLGMVLQYMLGKGRPNRVLKAICAKATAENREERYGSVQEFALDVSRYLDGLTVTAYRENVLEKIGRFYVRNRFFILLIAAYLMMRVSLLLFFKR